MARSGRVVPVKTRTLRNDDPRLGAAFATTLCTALNVAEWNKAYPGKIELRLILDNYGIHALWIVI